MSQTDQLSQRRGLLLGIAAFSLWGLIPLYFKAVAVVPPLELLAHRVLWSIVVLGLVVGWRRQWRVIFSAFTTWKVLRVLLVSTILIATNWFVFIWAVINHRILEASLGYFINPLVSVMLGMVFLGERLRRLSWLAIGIAVVGVVLQVVIAGSVPLVALILAFSFGLYGLLRKTASVDATVGLLVEILLLGPVALAYLVVHHLNGNLAFGTVSVEVDVLLLAAGLVTAIPLMCFNSAARILPLSTLGFLQYIAPSGQFLLAVMAFGEQLTVARTVSFLCIWCALGLFSWDRVRKTLTP